jgi:uncharacterized membrane protein
MQERKNKAANSNMQIFSKRTSETKKENETIRKHRTDRIIYRLGLLLVVLSTTINCMTITSHTPLENTVVGALFIAGMLSIFIGCLIKTDKNEEE